jgi:hypothetical protein
MGILPNVPSNTPPPAWFPGILFGPPRDETAYYAAFGRFVAAFALAEAGAHIAARYFSGLGEDAARVIFSGMRLSDLAEKLRKLTRKTGHFQEIDELLTHLDLISKERDKFVHRLVEYDRQTGFRVTNRLTVKSLDNVEQHTFTIEELKAMEDDCKAIFFRLGVSAKQLDEIRFAGSGLTLGAMYMQWRYKPPSRAKKPKQRRASPQSRRRQPRPSQG